MHGPRRPSSDDTEAREREQLAIFLAILLTVLLGGGFVVFLIVITLNVFLSVLGVALAVAAFVGIHYLLWGHAQTPPDGGED